MTYTESYSTGMLYRTESVYRTFICGVKLYSNQKEGGGQWEGVCFFVEMHMPRIIASSERMGVVEKVLVGEELIVIYEQ